MIRIYEDKIGEQTITGEMTNGSYSQKASIA